MKYIEINWIPGKIGEFAWISMAKQQVTVGLEPELIEAIDSYRQRLDVPVSRSKAIEALVLLGLKAATPQLALGLTSKPKVP